MYRFYLDDVLLPITPQKLTVTIKGRNKTLTLINEGDVNFLRTPGLTEISFDAVLPMLGQYHFADGYRRPDYYLALLERLMTGKKPFRFIVSRTSPSGRLLHDTNMKVSLEDYNIVEDAVKGPDVTVALSLKQWRDYGAKIVTVKTDAGSGRQTASVEKERDAGTAPAAKTHTVQKGDTLWALAAKYYGAGGRYGEIYNANMDKISNPNLIYPGQVLTIP